MPADISFAINYFNEEKITNLIIMIIGIISIVFSLVFLFIIKYSFFKGMAIPLLLIGMIQVTAGTIVYTRTAKDIIRIEEGFKTGITATKNSELIRMKKVDRNFVIYQWIEIALIFTGIILYSIFYRSKLVFWKGLALGLIIQASVILMVDSASKKNAEHYMIFLNAI